MGRVFCRWARSSTQPAADGTELPEGFETVLGEGGALVSGGEGQRVRLGRAMLRDSVRLAILDEPFRGLGPRAAAGVVGAGSTALAQRDAGVHHA